MVLESLSFEAGGEASNGSQPTVLSCGGIYVPRREVPTTLRNRRQIVNLPGTELSAKIFGYSPETADPLQPLLKKEFLN